MINTVPYAILTRKSVLNTITEVIMELQKHSFFGRTPLKKGSGPKRADIDATHGPLLSKIFLFAIPVLLTDVLQMLYNAADSIVVGNFAGHTALAAVSSTASLISMVTALLIGLATGSGIIIAKYYGAKEHQKMDDVLHTGMFVALVGGIFFAVTCWILVPTFLTWLSFPDDIFGEAKLYLRIYFLGIPFSVFYNFGAQALLATGDSRHPLIYLSVSGILNVILNIILDAAFGMGVAGVAIGTVASQLLSCILVIRKLTKGSGPLKLRIRRIHFSKEPCKDILVYGIPAGLSSALFAFSNMIIQSTINMNFTSAQIAGFGAESQIEHIPWFAMEAFVKTNVTFISQNYGAGKMDRIKRTFCLNGILCIGTALATGWLSILFGEPLGKMFCSDPDPKVIEVFIDACTGKLFMLCGFIFLNGIMDMFASATRGMGHPTFTTVISFISIIGTRLLYIYLFFPNTERTVSDMFLIYPLSWLVSAVLQCFLFLYFYRKTKKELKNRSAITE